MTFPFPLFVLTIGVTLFTEISTRQRRKATMKGWQAGFWAAEQALATIVTKLLMFGSFVHNTRWLVFEQRLATLPASVRVNVTQGSKSVWRDGRWTGV
jgi:hypothetical protein